MILSDSEILRRMAAGDIVIEPFDRECLGSNSYDVHLSPYVKKYRHYTVGGTMGVLRADKENATTDHVINAGGMLLNPGTLYLMSTVEYTETRGCVPFLDGKSSAGRLGTSIHCTAGRGDAGFCNHWTMEVFVVEPVLVFADMPIGQLIYHAMLGEVERPYDKKAFSTQRTTRDSKPVPSGMHKNFPLKERK